MSQSDTQKDKLPDEVTITEDEYGQRSWIAKGGHHEGDHVLHHGKFVKQASIRETVDSAIRSVLELGDIANLQVDGVIADLKKLKGGK